MFNMKPWIDFAMEWPVAWSTLVKICLQMVGEDPDLWSKIAAEVFPQPTQSEKDDGELLCVECGADCFTFGGATVTPPPGTRL